MANKKPLYTTVHNKPIFLGDKYFAVLNNESYVETFAKEDEDPRTIARFLTLTGAKKFLAEPQKYADKLKDQPAPKKTKQPEVVIAPKKTEEELLEEKLSKQSILEQLDSVTDENTQAKWIKRNDIKVVTSSSSLEVFSKSYSVIGFSWSIIRTPHCCGGRELGSHGGSVKESETRNLTVERLNKLCDIISEDTVKAISSAAKDYGIIAYVRDHGSISSVYGRMGFLLDNSGVFQKVTTFRNPNTNHEIAMYTISDEWRTN